MGLLILQLLSAVLIGVAVLMTVASVTGALYFIFGDKGK